MPLHSPDWTSSAMRWGQINIRENEPPNFDVAWWEAYWRELRLDGITLNAGGLVAYYPTALEDQHRSRWLGDRDLFGELVEAVKRCNMRVLARIDPGESYSDVYYRHPDWFAVDLQGQPLRDTEDPELYIPCMNGPYYWKFVPQIIAEIHDRYDVDGIFCSEWDGRRRICYCTQCAKLFHEATGLKLPGGADPRDMNWKLWMRWHQQRLEDLWTFWDSTTKQIKPSTFFMGNHSERGFLADQAEMIAVDNQHRRGDQPLWAVGAQGKRMRALTQAKKPYFHIFSSYSYARHVAKPEPEYRLYIADALLADSRPWFTMIGGHQDDRRQFPPLRDMYQWHARNQRHLVGRESLADVGIVFADREAFVPDSRGQVGLDGMYYAMLRSRIPFDMVHIERMAEDTLDRYKVLILPDVSCVSDEEAAALRSYVERGGALMATFATGARDEWGRERERGALDDVLGIVGRGPALGPLFHSYSNLHGPHPILEGLKDTVVTLGTEWVVPVVASAESNASLLTMTPPYIWYPPELAFSPEGDSGLPLLVLTEGVAGEGRRVYWTGDVDALVLGSNSPDHIRMLRQSVEWARGADAKVQVTGPGIVEVHPYRQSDALQIHLVNFTNPDAWRAPIQELIPVGAQKIRIRVPLDHTVSPEASCLVSERLLPVKVIDGWAELELPELVDHEIVVLPMEAGANGDD